MQPVKKSLGLGIALTLLLSSLPVKDARADGWIGMLMKLSPKSPNYTEEYPMKDQVLLGGAAIGLPLLIKCWLKDPRKALWYLLAALTTPYMIDFFTRSPLKEKRFDSDLLINGTWREKLMQIEYFIADVLIGWPYKPEKYAPETIDGKTVMKIQKKQYPGGYLGNIQSWLLFGGASGLGAPMKFLKQIKDVKDAFEFWSDPLNNGAEILWPAEKEDENAKAIEKLAKAIKGLEKK